MDKNIDFDTPLQKSPIPFLIIWKLKFGSIINVILAALQQRSYILFEFDWTNKRCSFSTSVIAWRLTDSPQANFLIMTAFFSGRKFKNYANKTSLSDSPYSTFRRELLHICTGKIPCIINAWVIIFPIIFSSSVLKFDKGTFSFAPSNKGYKVL